MTNFTANLDWIFLGTTLGKAVFAWGLTLGFILVNIFLERKVCAFIQDRVGPNRANVLGIRLFGFVLNFADAVKLIFKEDLTPPFVNKFYYLVAPLIIITVALMGMAIVPFADDLVIGKTVIPMRVLDLNVGFLFVLAVTSLSVYSLVLGGFGSNSKYPLLSAMRSSAQMISYEIVMGLSLVGLVMVFGTVHLHEMTVAQGGLLFGFIPKWGVVVQPLGCVLFCIAALAELNRTPFDLPEGESEIIGFHVEYSSMKFALFFMAEYANIFVAAAVITTLFFGGWQVPWLPTDAIKANAAPVLQASASLAAFGAIVIGFLLHRFYSKRNYKWKDLREKEGLVLYAALCGIVVLAIGAIAVARMVPFNPVMCSALALVLQIGMFIFKSFLICFTVVWIRWTLPRLRYDQLMALGWKLMLPLGIANILVTGVVMLVAR
jgi:NADH-quinone oxidoreductase subunit H